MENKSYCKGIKRDLEYINGILESRTHPIPDVERFKQQILFKKQLCEIRRKEKIQGDNLNHK
jgi:hypothetical protein